MPSLFVIQGRDQGRRFQIQDTVVSVGRDSANLIQLRDTEVSRRHAELRRDGNQYSLVDLESANGTFVNSRKVSQHALASGDRVEIGRTRMVYTGGDEPSSVDLARMVDIVTSKTNQENSRIVHSIRQEEGSELLKPEFSSESPWLARARSNLQVMYRTALAVSHTLDIDQLLNRIMELIFEWVEADRGCIMLVDQETDELTPAAHLSRTGESANERMVISRSILDYVLERNEGVLTSDAREDERWDGTGSIVRMGVREAICVPLQGRYGVVGVVYIDTYTPPGRSLAGSPPAKFTNDHLKLMVAIGHQAALAVEDTSYYGAMLQAERLAAVGQTIATLSHHIKNILQGIRGGSYLIEEGLKSSQWDVVKKGWGIVDRNQDKISNLVMDMLSFSKEREPELVEANLNDVANDVIELMASRAATAGVELTADLDPALPDLHFDPDGLHRAILNIVTNAIDACEKAEQGAISVRSSCRDDPHVAQLIIEDNGEGIPPDDIKRIFNVFASNKGSRGTGLGLPVSQKILREHNGDIFVESEVGKGSRFILQLPRK